MYDLTFSGFQVRSIESDPYSRALAIILNHQTPKKRKHCGIAKTKFIVWITTGFILNVF